MPEQTINTTSKILRLCDLVDKLGLSRSTIYDKGNVKSPRFDPLFPKRIKIGLRAVGWLESEVYTWLESMASHSRINVGGQRK